MRQQKRPVRLAVPGDPPGAVVAVTATVAACSAICGRGWRLVTAVPQAVRRVDPGDLPAAAVVDLPAAAVVVCLTRRMVAVAVRGDRPAVAVAVARADAWDR